MVFAVYAQRSLLWRWLWHAYEAIHLCLDSRSLRLQLNETRPNTSMLQSFKNLEPLRRLIRILCLGQALWWGSEEAAPLREEYFWSALSAPSKNSRGVQSGIGITRLPLYRSSRNIPFQSSEGALLRMLETGTAKHCRHSSQHVSVLQGRPSVRGEYSIGSLTSMQPLKHCEAMNQCLTNEVQHFPHRIGLLAEPLMRDCMSAAPLAAQSCFPSNSILVFRAFRVSCQRLVGES